MPEKEALANCILQFRHERHESQEAFASHCGISKESLSSIERVKANPTLGTMQNMAAYMGVTVADLLNIETKNGERGK